MTAFLWNRYRYVSNIKCLVSRPIRVYDIRQANISILRDKNYIDDSTYDMLKDAPKKYREVYIGKLIIKDPSVNNIIQDGIIESKHAFFDINHIEDSEILEIDNDAIYLMGDRYIPETNQWVSGRTYFKLSEHYSSFYALGNIKCFYFYENLHGTEYIKLKGMEKSRVLHEAYMLDFLKALFCTAQVEGVEEAIKFLNSFYTQYVNFQLPVGYYREFTSTSHFKINSGYHWYYIENPTSNMVRLIDISHNENILRTLQQYFTRLYFNRQIG